MYAWRGSYINVWVWDPNIITCNRFNRQMRWVLKFHLILHLVCMGNTGGTVWQYKRQGRNLTTLNPICLKRKYNLVSDHNVSPLAELQWACWNLLAALSKAVLLDFVNTPHILFGACYWLHISSENYCNSKKIECWGPHSAVLTPVFGLWLCDLQ